jgi:uncharacterized protein (TIGR03435 family)
MMNDDMDLVREYAANRSETAFETLVARHLNLVYSSAVRQVSDAALAQDIAQAVFIILAQKAGSLGHKTVLSGWLYRTTRYACADALKIQRRRQQREQEAFMQSQPSAPEVWLQIAPLLDDAMAQLDDKDRNVIILRYFENKSARDIADALGLAPPAAQKRLTRAVEKLRAYFAKRQLPHSADEIAKSISANSVCLAPAGLVKTIAVAGAAKGATAGGSTLIIAKGALKIMAWTQTKTVLLVGAGVLLAAGTATVAVVEIAKSPASAAVAESAYPWQLFPGGTVDYEVLKKAPPLLEIRPTMSTNNGSAEVTSSSGVDVTRLGRAYSILEMLVSTWNWSRARMVVAAELPPGRYDYIDSLPQGATQAFRDAIQKKFGIIARVVPMETNVLLLRIKTPNAPGLRPSPPESNAQDSSRVEGNFREFHTAGSAFSNVVVHCESILQIPVIDRTGLSGNYDVDLKYQWEWVNGQLENDAFKQAVLDQLGLEFIPARETIDMLVIERAKN